MIMSPSIELWISEAKHSSYQLEIYLIRADVAISLYQLFRFFASTSVSHESSFSLDVTKS
jgi:hypothetical protein